MYHEESASKIDIQVASDLLLNDIVTEMKKSSPSAIELLVIQGFRDEILIQD